MADKDFLTWRCGENLVGGGFTLSLLTLEEMKDCCWFNVKFDDGREYTVYDLERMINEFEGDETVVEAWEGNEEVTFRQDFNKFVEEHISLGPEKLAQAIWDEYNIKTPEC